MVYFMKVSDRDGPWTVNFTDEELDDGCEYCNAVSWYGPFAEFIDEEH